MIPTPRLSNWGKELFSSRRIPLNFPPRRLDTWTSQQNEEEGVARNQIDYIKVHIRFQNSWHRLRPQTSMRSKVKLRKVGEKIKSRWNLKKLGNGIWQNDNWTLQDKNANNAWRRDSSKISANKIELLRNPWYT